MTTTLHDMTTSLVTLLNHWITTTPVVRLEATEDMVQIGLDPAHPQKSQELRTWASYRDVIDLVLHRRSGTSHEVRLNLRGRAPHGEVVVVYTTYLRTTERQQVDAITTMIETAAPERLQDSLSALETARATCRALAQHEPASSR